MSSIVIFITYNGRHKQELSINDNESIRYLMSQMFTKFNISGENYDKQYFTLTNANTFLNADEDWLNKTIKDGGIEEDDTIDLKDAGSVQWG